MSLAQRVLVVLPAYNAAQTLARTVAAIPAGAADEILLVDDASQDATVREGQRLGLEIIVHDQNRGYGANQKTCYTEALQRRADIVVMVHPDFQYDPRRVPDMVRPIALGEADAVIGSRFCGTDPRRQGMPWWRYWGNRFLTTMQNRVLGLNLSECHSGYRAYHRRVLERLPFREFSDDFAYDSQMIVALAAFGFRIREISIATRYAPDSSSIGFLPSVRYGLQTITALRSFPGLRRRARVAHP